MHIRKHYERQERVHPDLNPVSMTSQSHGEECNINTIMAKWQKTGVIDHVNQFQGEYRDFTDMPTNFMEAQQQIMDAETMFMTLPSSVRKRFHNNPGAFLEFVANPANSEEMAKLGLTNASDPVLDPTPTKEPKLSEKAAATAPRPKKDPENPPSGD